MKPAACHASSWDRASARNPETFGQGCSARSRSTIRASQRMFTIAIALTLAIAIIGVLGISSA